MFLLPDSRATRFTGCTLHRLALRYKVGRCYAAHASMHPRRSIISLIQRLLACSGSHVHSHPPGMWLPAGTLQEAHRAAMPNHGGGGGTPLPDIAEETTPLRLLSESCHDHQQSQPASRGARAGAKQGGAWSSASAAAVKQTRAGNKVADGDLESRDPTGAASWLSQRLRWPVVPIYSDVGTGWVHHLRLLDLAVADVLSSWHTHVALRKQHCRSTLLAFVLAGEWWEATLHYVGMTAAPAGGRVHDEPSVRS